MIGSGRGAIAARDFAAPRRVFASDAPNHHPGNGVLQWIAAAIGRSANTLGAKIHARFAPAEYSNRVGGAICRSPPQPRYFQLAKFSPSLGAVGDSAIVDRMLLRWMADG